MTARGTGRSLSRRFVAKAAALALVGGCAMLATSGSAAAGSEARGRPPVGHVTGDAWVSFSIDPGNPLRRFIFDAHGGPYKVVGGRLVMGDAHGTVRFNHPAPGPDGVVRDNWGSVKVDYLMTAGPVAVVSGTSTGGPGWPAGTRMSFSVYDDPRGDRYDRMGFSWGVVDGRCVRMGLAPAPFTTYKSGKGYRVRAAELPAITGDVQPPVDPPACN